MTETVTFAGNSDTLCTTARTELINSNFTPSVKGRLKQHLDFWKFNLKASNFVLNIIENGYILPFMELPPPFHAKNNASSLRNKRFVDNAITELLEKGMVEELDSRPYVCKESVDRFANNLNKKVIVFYSKFYRSGTCGGGVDAFTKNWSRCELNWLCPPVNLISACVQHLKTCHGK